MREVIGVRAVGVDWRLLSLETINSGNRDSLGDPARRGTAALRTLALVRRRSGNDAVDSLYRSIGAKLHEARQRPTAETVREALRGCGMDEGTVDEALADESTIDAVLTEHDDAVARGAFGVPTLVLGSGRAMFGPVVAVAPTGEEAGAMWDHVRWLVRRGTFYELKRERDRRRPG